MNEHQHRLWIGMIELIDSYLNDQNQDFYLIVGKLEGVLDASEIKDNNLIYQWYDFWTPLEIRRAIEGNQPNRDKAIKELNAMRSFLLKHLYFEQGCQERERGHTKMDAIKIGKNKVLLEISRDELGVLCNALNEVCNGIEVWEFETRMGVKIENARIILDSLTSMLAKAHQTLSSYIEEP